MFLSLTPFARIFWGGVRVGALQAYALEFELVKQVPFLPTTWGCDSAKHTDLTAT